MHEGGGLHRAPGDRPADGDGLELGHDDWNETMLQGGRDEVGKSDTWLRHRDAAFHVDIEYLVELGHVDLLVAAPLVRSFRYLVRHASFLERNRTIFSAACE